MTSAKAFEALRSAFEQAGIRYAVGGSWASTAFGDPRFTNDVDILAEVTTPNLDALLERLPADFYVDRDDAKRALSHGRCFNLIHMPTVLKFDLVLAAAFPLGKDELDRAVLVAGTGLAKQYLELPPSNSLCVTCSPKHFPTRPR